MHLCRVRRSGSCSNLCLVKFFFVSMIWHISHSTHGLSPCLLRMCVNMLVRVWNLEQTQQYSTYYIIEYLRLRAKSRVHLYRSPQMSQSYVLAIWTASMWLVYTCFDPARWPQSSHTYVSVTPCTLVMWDLCLAKVPTQTLQISHLKTWSENEDETWTKKLLCDVVITVSIRLLGATFLGSCAVAS